MKKLFLISLTSLLILTFEGCKKSDVTSPPPQDGIQITEDSFPKNDGTNYKYSYTRIDSTGQISGIRITYYKGSKTIQGTTYKIQIDSLIVSPLPQIDSSYFRTTNAGMYLYTDTTGFVASISDSSLIPLIPFIAIDEELLTYSFPLHAGTSWPVLKINLTSPVFVTVVDISAIAVGDTTIFLNLQTGQTSKEALNVKFTLTLRLNSTSSESKIFTANAWLVQNIGPVKWEGSCALINVLTGLGIDFADTTTVVDQNLIDYTIK
jgi:hypothetical protein